PGVSRGARRAVLQPRDLLRSGRLRASAGRGVLWRARRPRGATPPRGDVDRGGVRARSTYPTLLLVAGTTFVRADGRWSPPPGLYGEAGNRWGPRRALPAPRGASGAASVSGKLIVVGGWGLKRRLAETTAIYDPAVDRWRDAAPIPTPRDHLAATAVNGVVYAIGGRPLDPDRNYDVLEAYDPATDRWTTRAAMPSRRGGLAAAALDGTVHTVGGESRSGVFANHEVYDPVTDRWSVAPPLPLARHGLAAAALGGRLYVIGGGPRAGFAQTDVVDVFAP